MAKCSNHTTVGGAEDPEDKSVDLVTERVIYHDIYCPNCGKVAGRTTIRTEKL